MLLVVTFFILFFLLAYFRASLGTFTFVLSTFMVTTLFTNELVLWYWLPFLIIIIPLNFRHLRRIILTKPLFRLLKYRLPLMTDIEKTTIEAGSSWWEAELFRGAPNWHRLHNYPAPRLTSEEQAFIDGPLERLCAMSCNWAVSHKQGDLSPEVWDFIKEQRFFAMTIEKRYGGHQFSAFAISSILQTLASFSTVLASTVGAPNSLGPSSLIQQYGTKDQKKHYLPKLAQGDEIPCFAITSVEAGSDIASIIDTGIVCKQEYLGEQCLGIKLSWNKRYVTLAPIASLIGLAFKLKDPEHLLGSQLDIGITCALIPANRQEITIGRRHNPLNTPFQTGPISACNLFIPLDNIIGGVKMAGKGWNMLIECLSIGRGLILPACSTGTVKMAALSSGAYSRVRHQFNQAISRHQGIEEPLARLAGNAYLMDAATRLTVTALDMGESPSVISAIVKYHLTHRAQNCLVDAMAIHGGKGICMGPNNYLASFYLAAPIATTVEGANILTRSLIIYGQGAIRSHPYLLSELKAATMNDPHLAIDQFDRAIFSHIGYGISNWVRSFWFAFSGGYFIVPPFKDKTARYYQLLTRYSTYLALLSDIVIGLLGGKIKQMERTSARLGDILSQLYLGSATLKRFEDEGRQQEDSPLMHMAMRDCITRLEQSLDELLKNFPSKRLRPLLQLLIFPLGRPASRRSDKIEHKVSQLLTHPNESRDRLGSDCYLKAEKNNPAGQLEAALTLIVAAEPLVTKVGQSIGKQLPFRQLDQIADKGLKLNLISKEEAALLCEAEQARLQTINVDDFSNW